MASDFIAEDLDDISISSCCLEDEDEDEEDEDEENEDNENEDEEDEDDECDHEVLYVESDQDVTFEQETTVGVEKSEAASGESQITKGAKQVLKSHQSSDPALVPAKKKARHRKGQKKKPTAPKCKEEEIITEEELKQEENENQWKMTKTVAVGAGVAAVAVATVGLAVVTGGTSLLAKAAILAGIGAVKKMTKKNSKKKK
ncbi:46 kDa FK506-binding nuclear protein-like [Danio aesculapii]|uniref:46 kDa FK506-binding nuclear protein-like n=1 Tax=Danio aesculapii TaxID=1142201 RepID=UPI0024BF9F72|nr:46 kDa FK506-binding nuclear protein-like [Danio aesculapii]